ncbi:MAG TPA: glutamate racemase, partial [bacterium (Candidatus Stahlbacteria)]|nr:glutamate racemase [Candidatus Stahlbacteria bacterium]
IYLGDTAHLPYGTKSKEAIVRFSIANSQFLQNRGAELLAIACHSSASVATEELKKRFKLPIVDVVSQGAKAVARLNPKMVGVIGTVATIESGSYIEELRKVGVGCEIVARACPLLVSIVEEGIITGPIAELIVDYYLDPLKTEGIDTLLLGCTHFPILIPVIEKILPGVRPVDPAVEVAREIAMMQPKVEGGKVKIYLTDLSPNYQRLTRCFLGEEVSDIIRATLEG